MKPRSVPGIYPYLRVFLVAAGWRLICLSDSDQMSIRRDLWRKSTQLFKKNRIFRPGDLWAQSVFSHWRQADRIVTSHPICFEKRSIWCLQNSACVKRTPRSRPVFELREGSHVIKRPSRLVGSIHRAPHRANRSGRSLGRDRYEPSHQNRAGRRREPSN